MCPLCGSTLILDVAEDCPDKLQWVCHGLKREYHKLPQEQRNCTELILEFVNFWVSNCPLTFICKELSISRETAVDWYFFCREVILDAFIIHKQKLGGVGKTVEIYESKFGKRKFHRGHSVEGQWIFGGYERGTGKVFMIPVEDRSANALLPIIRDWIEPGTTLISDYWEAYGCLSLQGYEDMKDKHSLTFKDTETDAHTNVLESSWHAAKNTMTSSGRTKSHIPGNLAKYIFQKRCAKLKLNWTVEFLHLAGQLYSPLAPREFPQDEDMTDDSDCD